MFDLTILRGFLCGPHKDFVTGCNCNLLNCFKSDSVIAVTSAPVSTLSVIRPPLTAMLTDQSHTQLL